MNWIARVLLYTICGVLLFISGIFSILLYVISIIFVVGCLSLVIIGILPATRDRIKIKVMSEMPDEHTYELKTFYIVTYCKYSGCRLERHAVVAGCPGTICSQIQSVQDYAEHIVQLAKDNPNIQFELYSDMPCADTADSYRWFRENIDGKLIRRPQLFVATCVDNTITDVTEIKHNELNF